VLSTWLIDNLTLDNIKYTPKLLASFRAADITPFRLVRDYEGRIYQFANGEYFDKGGFWKCEYIEFKAALNVPGRLYPCDFAPQEFNNDFCITYHPESMEHRKRVEADGGQVEAIDCLSSALIKYGI